LTFYGLPLSHTDTPVEVANQPPPTSLPHGVQYEIHTLPVRIILLSWLAAVLLNSGYIVAELKQTTIQ